MVSLYFFQDNNFTMFQHQQTSGSNLTSPRTLDPTLSTQLEGHPGSPNVNLTPPLNTGMQPHSSGKAEPGLFPTRCFSPNGLEQKRGPRVSEKVNRVLNVSSSISVCRRLLQEVKLDDSKQHKVGVTILTIISSHPVSWLSIFVIVTHSWIVLQFIAEKKRFRSPLIVSTPRKACSLRCHTDQWRHTLQPMRNLVHLHWKEKVNIFFIHIFYIYFKIFNFIVSIQLFAKNEWGKGMPIAKNQRIKIAALESF